MTSHGTLLTERVFPAEKDAKETLDVVEQAESHAFLVCCVRTVHVECICAVLRS